jgi:hypothetical protein
MHNIKTVVEDKSLNQPKRRNKLMDRIAKALEKLGMPKGDLYELPTSPKTFPDGDFTYRDGKSPRSND